MSVWSKMSQKKQRPNRCIGDAIHPPTDTKLTKKCGSKFDVLLWRHLTPQTKTAIYVHNYNPSCIQLLKKDLGKFTSYMTFGAHNLYIPSRFWTTDTNLTLAVSTM